MTRYTDSFAVEIMTLKPYQKWRAVRENTTNPSQNSDNTNIVICVTITAISCVILITIYLCIQRQFKQKAIPASLSKCSCPPTLYSYYVPESASAIKCSDFQIMSETKIPQVSIPKIKSEMYSEVMKNIEPYK